MNSLEFTKFAKVLHDTVYAPVSYCLYGYIYYIFKSGAPATPSFLKLFLCGRLYVCVCVRVCVSTPRLLITSSVMWHDMDSI